MYIGGDREVSSIPVDAGCNEGNSLAAREGETTCQTLVDNRHNALEDQGDQHVEH